MKRRHFIRIIIGDEAGASPRNVKMLSSKPLGIGLRQSIVCFVVPVSDPSQGCSNVADIKAFVLHSLEHAIKSIEIFVQKFFGIHSVNDTLLVRRTWSFPWKRSRKQIFELLEIKFH